MKKTFSFHLMLLELGVLITRGDISGDYQINFDKFKNGLYLIKVRRESGKIKKLIVIK